MAVFPPLKVTFDDGEVIEFTPKPRDLALAERDYHHDYNSGGLFRSAYVTALASLHRMQRAGELNGRVLPDTPDQLMDMADVETIVEEDEGKDSGPAPTTG